MTPILLSSVMIIIQLRRMLLHHLLRSLNGVLTFRLRHFLFVGFHVILLGLFLGMFIEEIHNFAITSCSLVHGESRCEFSMRAELDVVEKIHGEILAVVADEIVLIVHVSKTRSVITHLRWLPYRWSLLAHGMDCYLACSSISLLFSPAGFVN